MDWKSLLRDEAVVPADGACGTQLAARGLPSGTVPELWNAENPDAVRAVVADYVEVGARFVLTNTFGGSRWKLAHADLADRAVELNRRGVELAKEAAGDRAFVLASVGPTGRFMVPLGDKPREAFVEVFAEQIGAAAAGGADGVCLETMIALDEMTAALDAARAAAPGLPIVASLTYDKGPRGYATMMGVRPEQAAAALEEAGADLIGSNCGNGPENMVEVAQTLRAATRLPLWVKPNAGMPELVGGETVFRKTPDEMAAYVAALVTAGAQIIGGCCGTTPAHIRAIAEACRAHRETAREASAEVLAALA